MKKIAFFDTKPYDKEYFQPEAKARGYEIKFFEHRLNADTAGITTGFDAVSIFVNDNADKSAIERIYSNGITVIALRCAGFNNVDIKEAYGKVHIVRVPAYSPYAVAEHAMAMLLTVNRKTHKAYNRTREFNYSLNNLTGFDMHGKTAGIIGTGKIGRVFIDICRGFGMKVMAYDPYPAAGIDYVSLERLCADSDIISLHCPLSESTRHIINAVTLGKMKETALLVNTSRGALIDSNALLDALKKGVIGGACLDVYEEESDYFFEDLSDKLCRDDTLALLTAMPNVLVTSHQAFLTKEALKGIACITMDNLDAFFNGQPMENEICYRCAKFGTCKKDHGSRCF